MQYTSVMTMCGHFGVLVLVLVIQGPGSYFGSVPLAEMGVLTRDLR
jgi:hypothetical protein